MVLRHENLNSSLPKVSVVVQLSAVSHVWFRFDGHKYFVEHQNKSSWSSIYRSKNSRFHQMCIRSALSFFNGLATTGTNKLYL